jgi:LPXTG-motif cell wall-anchored protein
MRRSSACALLAAGAIAPLLWAVPAFADPGYPPTGPSSGSGGETLGGGTLTPGSGLPRTGQDLQTPGLVGGGAVLAGSILLIAGRSRSRRAQRRAPAL